MRMGRPHECQLHKDRSGLVKHMPAQDELVANYMDARMDGPLFLLAGEEHGTQERDWD